ncbi:MAG: DUF2330 domain-containing protein [Fimbriimonadaceae bacterium]|nr:MAG: DUF2330 domain-containing protein [Fimbriimonadaceae bacterium]
MRNWVIVPLLAVPALSQPCCGISSAGEKVLFGQQENIIVWNPTTKTEYFIRNARFSTESKEFSFVAPTPTEPTMSKSSSEAFRFLQSKQPRTDTKGMDAAAGTASSPAANVEIISETEVAGYKATVIKAGDSKAFTDWLNANDYSTTPSTQKWADTYIKKGWYLTAFKVINKDEAAETGIICMKFKAEKPFNPYYVPDDNIDVGQGLQLYFITDGKVDGHIGEDAGKSWRKASWTNSMTHDDMTTLAEHLEIPAGDIPFTGTVMAFTDYSFPKTGQDDIFFTPVPGTTAKEQKQKAVMLGTAAGAGIGIAVALLYSKRRKIL